MYIDQQRSPCAVRRQVKIEFLPDVAIAHVRDVVDRLRVHGKRKQVVSVVLKYTVG
jgi:hypothetical protein